MHLFTAFIPSHCTPSRLPQIIMCSAHCEQQEEGQHPPAPWAQHSTSPLQFPWDTGKLCRTEPLVTSVWRLKGCLIWQLGACCDKGELWTQINCLLMSSIEGSSICDSDCVCANRTTADWHRGKGIDERRQVYGSFPKPSPHPIPRYSIFLNTS